MECLSVSWVTLFWGVGLAFSRLVCRVGLGAEMRISAPDDSL